MRNVKACAFCNETLLVEETIFPGTTIKTKDNTYMYSRCCSCYSLINRTENNPDYMDYATGSEISNIKVKRFLKFLKKCGVKEKSAILDYGCGNGALFLKLRTHFPDTDGYEPFNEKYSILSGKKYDVVYLTHAFEHISDYNKFFENLNNVTKQGSLVITIHPSSTRIPRLNPACPYQSYTIHAPFHVRLPSDKATIDLFQKQGYILKQSLPYDVQRSGIKDNNRVSALLAQSLGGLKENWLGASQQAKMRAVAKSPFRFFYNMFIRTRDRYVSTFVFETSEIINRNPSAVVSKIMISESAQEHAPRSSAAVLDK